MSIVDGRVLVVCSGAVGPFGLRGQDGRKGTRVPDGSSGMARLRPEPRVRCNLSRPTPMVFGPHATELLAGRPREPLVSASANRKSSESCSQSAPTVTISDAASPFANLDQQSRELERCEALQ